MPQISLKAPAKINLYLKVLDKRPDGYHNILTLFERISLADRLTFKTNTSGRITITCNHPQVPTGPKNLVHKTATLIRELTGSSRGVDIDIDKSIPVAAGLAGGSTNAATAILGLNRLWRLKLTLPDMVGLARRIGSDVPFFLYDASWGLGTERGDRIKTLPLKRRLWHILVVPKIKMYTPKVYGHIKISKNDRRRNEAPGGGRNMLTNPDDDVNILLHQLQKSDVRAVSSLLYNDLEKVVVQICPKISFLKERLKSLGAQGVTVSGSGPSVYGLTDSQKEAKQIQAKLSSRYSQVFVVRTL
ncbi:MAG: 4-(cytidine 5'-diphospho)-2-C-methyl-D-erythritol kinase [Candidatus Omnitrophica bacterium]|nr:4-(cytidine 5'-diphospho)-2-C-methyl-D-erythritol kinase [Candidatus Omnitrophota bacterium]